jgi:hypothetical protein
MKISGFGAVFSVYQTREIPRGREAPERWVGLGPQLASGAERLLLPKVLRKSHPIL